MTNLEMTDFAIRPDVASRARAALQEAIRVDPLRMAEAQLLLTEVLANALAHSKAKTVRLDVANDVTAMPTSPISPSGGSMSKAPTISAASAASSILRRASSCSPSTARTRWWQQSPRSSST